MVSLVLNMYVSPTASIVHFMINSKNLALLINLYEWNVGRASFEEVFSFQKEGHGYRG